MNAVNAANVVARALIPIIGVLFLDWSGTALLVVYFADTLASIYAYMVVIEYAMLPRGTDRTQTEDPPLRAGLRAFVHPLPFLAVVGIFFGVLPLFVMLDIQDVSWSLLLNDRQLLIAVACQFLGAFMILTRMLGTIPAVVDPRQHVRRLLGPLAARWGILVFVGFFLSRFIPSIVYGPLLIVTYAAATALLELAPERVLVLFDGGPRRKN